MIRRFNYTGRRKIRREDVQITVLTGAEGASFNAQFDLSSYNLPVDALVAVEAQRRSRFMRFPWGTVGSPLPPSDRRLRAFESADSVLFRLKVTGAGEHAGKLLAVADRLRPLAPDEQPKTVEPLLPVASEPLNGELWRVDFDDGKPRLLIDEHFDRDEVARHPAFVATALPAAFREILTRAYVVEEYNGGDGDVEEDDWPDKWFQLARSLGVSDPLSDWFEADNRAANTEFHDWVNEAVGRFCQHHDLVRRSSRIWRGEVEQ